MDENWCKGSNQYNFQLHRFTVSENIAITLRGYIFYSHCIEERAVQFA